MALQEAIADAPPWEERSYDQLKEIVNRGFAGGDEFVLATFEMERRARDRGRANAVAEAGARRSEQRQRLALVAVLLAVVIAAIAAVQFAHLF